MKPTVSNFLVGIACVAAAWICFPAYGQTASRPPPLPPPPKLAHSPVTAPHPTGASPIPKDAMKAILSAFNHYEVVGMGAGHGDKDLDDFILDLVRNPAFPNKVDDIVVECGNSLYQPILDKYIAGQGVSLDEVRKVWRNTFQPMCGLSGFYDELFPLIRRINMTLPPTKKIRVLAAEPPTNWPKIKNRYDLKHSSTYDTSRDIFIASVMEKEVFDKRRSALMLFGIDHLLHGVKGSAVDIYEKDFPGKTFIIAKHNGFGLGTPYAKYNNQFEARMSSWPVPSLVLLKGTWLASLLAKLPSGAFWMRTAKGPNGKDVTTYVPNDTDKITSRSVDAYLYLGPGRLQLSEPTPAYILLDKKYVRELKRRAKLIQSPIYDAVYPKNVFKAACSRFYNDTCESGPSS